MKSRDFEQPSTSERGYGRAHRELRAQLALVVDGGGGWCTAAVCLEPTRWIRPGTSWDLGHLPDRSGYAGAQHYRCNRSDGGKRGNPRRRPGPRVPSQPRWRPTRSW